MDSKAYIDEEGWGKVMKYIDERNSSREFNEEYILKRYDGVVHLETAAKGAEKFYKNGWTVDDMGKKVFRKNLGHNGPLDDNRTGIRHFRPQLRFSNFKN